MSDRPLGITTLAFSSIMVALYCQMAAIVLLATGSVYTAAGSMPGAVVLFLGAIFLGLTVASYLLGFGFWTGRRWSWAGGIVVFTVLLACSIFLAVLSTNLLSAVLPSVAAILGIAYLQRPAVRARLLGHAVDARRTVSISDRLDAPELAH